MRDIPLTDLRKQELRDKANRRCPNPNARKYHPRGGESQTYTSPNYGDGGWHTTPGCFDMSTFMQYEPRNDHILVRITEVTDVKTFLHVPESARTVRGLTRIGTVLKCGPGKWISGEWWNVRRWIPLVGDYRAWEWFPGHRQEMIVKPGMKVAIGQFDDYHSLDAGFGESVVLCQEGDVRAILA